MVRVQVRVLVVALQAQVAVVRQIAVMVVMVAGRVQQRGAAARRAIRTAAGQAAARAAVAVVAAAAGRAQAGAVVAGAAAVAHDGDGDGMGWMDEWTNDGVIRVCERRREFSWGWDD